MTNEITKMIQTNKDRLARETNSEQRFYLEGRINGLEIALQVFEAEIEKAAEQYKQWHPKTYPPKL